MTAAKNVREALDRDTVIGLIEFWWRCVEAGREIDGDDALADDAVILHYSGCGASAMVTAGHFRALLSATAAGDAVLVAEVTGADEYGPMLAWHRHWVDCIGKKLYLKDSK